MTGPPLARWEVHRLVGEAAELHGRPLPSPPGRQLWLCQVTRPALVLGSGARQQDFVDQDLASRWGVDVVHRRSGGAAVLLEPGAQLWADLLIGREDPLWQDDIGRAAWWVGAWWQRSLARCGIATTVHQGRLQGGVLAGRICFAGVGPGEVLAEGRKLVGLSQRRTRDVARLQTVMLMHWRPEPLAELCGWPARRGSWSALGPLPAEGDTVDRAAALGDVAVGLGELLARPQTGTGIGTGTGRTRESDAIDQGLFGRLEAALIEELPGA